MLCVSLVFGFCLFCCRLHGGSSLRCYLCSSEQQGCHVEGNPGRSYRFTCLAPADKYCVKGVSGDGTKAVRLCSKEAMDGCDATLSINTMRTKGCAFSCDSDLCNGIPSLKPSPLRFSSLFCLLFIFVNNIMANFQT